ncbi:ABC transporter ATP-binding protein [Nocardioides alcanivorans]|uniref:ABC transporter ATP-binding protein n=1 Tax=Nocardioides alcanivorans TaxID=2897352 RepID=UPI001F40E1E0|nr:ABC transporter ATP-binding protein [Nocardioides alcanivorans]
MAEESAIHVSELRRTYGSGDATFEAVRGVDLRVAAGSVTALLGTNGAGKTSTLEVIEGLAPAASGSVRVLGLDPWRDRDEVRRRTGVLLQASGFSGDLSVRETLRMWSGLVSRARPVDELLELLRLTGRAATRVRVLSGGERRRLDLACTLLAHPEVLFLDEPTTGLDPESRRDVWELVRGLRDTGTTVLVTTHYLEEAEALADRLEIMHAGRIVRSGSPHEIAEGHPATIQFLSLPQLPDLAVEVTHDRGTTVLRTADLQRTLTDLLVWADRAGHTLEGLQARTATLESVFLDIASSEPSTEGDR